jgi:hypothetical protein
MAKVKRFGQGGSSSEPKRYIKRGPNGAQPASKPPVYQKEVAVRKPSDASSTNSKDVASKAKSTGIRPKVYEGELNGGEVANRGRTAGNIGRDAIEGERVVSNRGSSSASSTGGKGVSSSPTSSSRAVSPKVYEGDVSGSIPKNASGKASGNVYEGERVSRGIPNKPSNVSEGSYRELSETPSSSTSSRNSSQYGLKEASPRGKGVGARVSNISPKLTSSVVKGLGRVAGPAAMAMGAKELYDSYKKYDELMPGTKPNMSKKSDSIVDAINSDSDASTRAKSRGANREAMYGSQKDVSKESSPDVEIKKTEIVKTAPAASKPALKSGTSKPKGPTEGDRARAALKEFKAWNDSRAPLDSDSTTAEDMNTQGKIEAVEGMKKGGMTKRPPKPAKKVPPRKFASGGSVSRTSASKRGDGCATKGHTKGNMR